MFNLLDVFILVIIKLGGKMSKTTLYDVVIVGAGPAGLSGRKAGVRRKAAGIRGAPGDVSGCPGGRAGPAAGAWAALPRLRCGGASEPHASGGQGAR